MQALSVWCVNSDSDSSATSATLLEFIISLKERFVQDCFVKTSLRSYFYLSQKVNTLVE